MGSYIAQRFAVDHPERTIGLVLIGAFRTFDHDPGLEEFRKELDEVQDPVPEQLAREFQESTIARPLAPGQLEQAIAESCKVPARVWRAALDGLLEAEPPTDGRLITAPTRILWGDRDAYCPRDEQLSLTDAIPGAELIVYEGTGHALHWEEPARAAADVDAFVSPRGPRRPRLAEAR
jgi:non-heme chloroperoxidase